MIIVESIMGNTRTMNLENRTTDLFRIEWFETGKRVLRRHTTGGQEIALRFMRENPLLQQDDIVWMDEQRAIVISIQPAEALVLRPGNMADMAAICYEIGNKHLPLFLEGNEVLVPFEEPLFRWLAARGYTPVREQRILSGMLRSNVVPHDHSSSLFSKIMQLASK